MVKQHNLHYSHALNLVRVVSFMLHKKTNEALFFIMRRFIDIGANLTDPMFKGFYNNCKKHESDLQDVLTRSWEAGIEKIFLTGTNLEDSKKALELAHTDDRLMVTVGCHPTRCGEFEKEASNPDDYLDSLKNVVSSNGGKVVAIGECGLDYNRLHFCPKEIQKKYFERQLKLSQIFNLPLFLHCRNAAADLYDILLRYPGLKGVVHSFDGTPEEAKRFLDLGYYIGLNGCSLKTRSNLETVKTLPKERILFETDSPWCDVRSTHAGYSFVREENLAHPSVKKEKYKPGHVIRGRNEPRNISQILDIVAAVRDEDPDELAEVVYKSTTNLFL